mmetsp:Transcript_14652/g.22712  ORF Transcript_14652/g.22712 Transcript_14652/m.22712 type:complete len:85 (+) Transcript_14652:156-410(+)
MKIYFDNDDFDMEMQNAADSIRSGFIYIGASRAYYASLFIYEYSRADKIDRMKEYYPTFIEASIEFRTYSRKLLAEHNGGTYEP